MEPCVTLDGNVGRHTSQGEKLLAAVLLKHLLLLGKLVGNLAEDAWTLRLQTVDNLVELVGSKLGCEALGA